MPALTERPSMWAGGDLVISESILRLPVRTRPLLPQGSLCPPSKQKAQYLMPFQPAPLTQGQEGPHLDNMTLGTQRMVLLVPKISATTTTPMPEIPLVVEQNFMAFINDDS